jgi:hypothetical protein
MQTTAEDLADESRHAPDPETRQIAWALLLRLASEGDDEAREAINKLSRTSKRHRDARATLGDTLKITHHKG